MTTSRALILLLLWPLLSCPAADPNTPDARELAARLTAIRLGDAYVRFVMQIKSGARPATLQVQVRERHTKDRTDVLYQVLWPGERKGEAVLLHQQAGRPPEGASFTPPDSTQNLTSAQMSTSVLGSNLAYEDVIEDFYAWPDQVISGNETVNNVNCAVVESKPAPGQSIYGKVKSWVDTRRMVPLRIEKYSSDGALVRRIVVSRVANDDKGHAIPADLVVTSPKQPGQTNLNGSRIHSNITFSDQDFTPQALRNISIPH